MKPNQFFIPITCTFIWLGFIGAISFMEAWLKFRAPGITLPLGLGIGRLVFAALNKVEWFWALSMIANLVFYKVNFKTTKYVFFGISLCLLIIQTAWLLPALDARAEQHIQGLVVPPSNLHFCYVGVELVKAICLSLFGITTLREALYMNQINTPKTFQ